MSSMASCCLCFEPEYSVDFLPNLSQNLFGLMSWWGIAFRLPTRPHMPRSARIFSLCFMVLLFFCDQLHSCSLSIHDAITATTISAVRRVDLFNIFVLLFSLQVVDICFKIEIRILSFASIYIYLLKF